jgi:hypothetical protein
MTNLVGCKDYLNERKLEENIMKKLLIAALLITGTANASELLERTYVGVTAEGKSCAVTVKVLDVTKDAPNFKLMYQIKAQDESAALTYAPIKGVFDKVIESKVNGVIRMKNDGEISSWGNLIEDYVIGVGTDGTLSEVLLYSGKSKLSNGATGEALVACRELK